MTGGVQTLRNVSAYKEPTWHFDAQFIDKQGHAKAKVQIASGHGHFLEMKIQRAIALMISLITT